MLTSIDPDTSAMAWVVFILFATFEFIWRFHYGGARHSYDVPPEYYYGNFWVSRSADNGGEHAIHDERG